jgi:hypothetical protein
MDVKDRKLLERFLAFSLEEKVAVVLFILISLGGLVYGLRGIFFQLEKPFLAQLNYTGPKYLSIEEREAQEIEMQKKNDTDEDGINDYDETYVYNSSPYLADTDSDGIDDAQEIKLGKNPSCPEGQNCYGALASAEAEGETSGSLEDFTGSSTPDIDFSKLTDSSDLKERIALMSADDLRQIVLDTGVDKAVVAKLSDEQIRDLFNKAADDTEQSGVIDQLLKQREALNNLEAEE